MYWVSAGPHSNILDGVDKAEHTRQRRLLSHAFATRNLVDWVYKVADKTRRLTGQFDSACSAAVNTGHFSAEIDLRKWSDLFTVETIADIGLSYRMGMLGRGDDLMTVELSNGRRKEYNFIDSLHGGNRATSLVVWSTAWFQTIQAFLKRISPFFRAQWQHGENYGDNIRHMTRTRLE